MPRLTISFGMCWQQRSSGNKYNLNSGHAFCIGGYSKKILDYCIKSNVCSIGDYASPPGGLRQLSLMFVLRIICLVVPSRWNVIPVLKWWSRQWRTIKSSTPQWFAITILLKERANCKWSYKYLQLQNSLFEWPKSNSGAKKANHGCLPLHIKEPVFLSDPIL